MTNQEIFDKAVGGIIAQGGPAVDKDGRCMYRAPNGNKCAAGQLMLDENYSPELEGRGAHADPVMEALGFENYDIQYNLITELQGAHDNPMGYGQVIPNDYMDQFKNRARDIAERYGLDTSVLDRSTQEV